MSDEVHTHFIELACSENTVDYFFTESADIKNNRERRLYEEEKRKIF